MINLVDAFEYVAEFGYTVLGNVKLAEDGLSVTFKALYRGAPQDNVRVELDNNRYMVYAS